MNLVLSGLFYSVSMLRYFWEGFEKLQQSGADLKIFTVGPYFGNYIPWNGGMNLPIKYNKPPTFPLPRQTANVHLHPQMLVDVIPPDIDLWLQIDAGWHLSVRPPAKIVGLIETDPHCLREHYKLPKSYSDIVWNMQDYYMETGDVYLPYGVPELHCFPETSKLEYDAALVGLHYQHRDDLVRLLRNRGLSIYYDIGIIYDEFRDIYNKSKLALSWSSLKDTPVRVFEAFGMSRPLIANRTNDLCQMFDEGKDFLGFSHANEAAEQVEWALKHPEEIEAMRWNGHNKAMDHHRFIYRCEQVLDDVERMR